MQISVRQQREITRTLDCRINLALIMRAGTGQAGWHDLAVFLDKIL